MSLSGTTPPSTVAKPTTPVRKARGAVAPVAPPALKALRGEKVVTPPTLLLKTLTKDGAGPYKYKAWPLPKQGEDGTWTPGNWNEVKGPLQVCYNGLHLTRLANLDQWRSDRLFVAEVADKEILEGGDKLVARKVRLVREILSWTAFEEATKAPELQPISRSRYLTNDEWWPFIQEVAVELLKNGGLNEEAKALRAAKTRTAGLKLMREVTKPLRGKAKIEGLRYRIAIAQRELNKLTGVEPGPVPVKATANLLATRLSKLGTHSRSSYGVNPHGIAQAGSFERTSYYTTLYDQTLLDTLLARAQKFRQDIVNPPKPTLPVANKPSVRMLVMAVAKELGVKQSELPTFMRRYR